ncbi:hypothetical protein CT19431_MP90014 [Cupriavidus taiwanensis]|nr:hypothetical protein CT19431_MP90014 [Cupriavidus taiwanensis]
MPSAVPDGPPLSVWRLCSASLPLMPGLEAAEDTLEPTQAGAAPQRPQAAEVAAGGRSTTSERTRGRTTSAVPA